MIQRCNFRAKTTALCARPLCRATSGAAFRGLAPICWLLACLVPASLSWASPPELDPDPFRPPPDRGAGDRKTPSPKEPGKDVRESRWYVRPTVGFVGRLSPDRRFLPKEGFGFALEAGAVLGDGRLRFALGASYEYNRIARSIDIQPSSPDEISCTDIRSASYHMVLGQAMVWMDFRPVFLWAGISGGFVHGAVRSPNQDCSTSGKEVPQGTLGPDLGFAYALRPDLLLGVYLRSRHFFSTEHFENAEGARHRIFYPLVTTGLSLTLRF